MAKGCKKNLYLDGKMIEPLDVSKPSTVKEFVDNVFGASGYNARRLSEACEIYTRMLKEKTTVSMTLAGAMTPIGMSGPIIDLMKKGFLDFIVSTGANIYHDLHRAFNFPVVQGSQNADDYVLNKHGVARIYDTYIGDDETLLPTDRIILEAVLDHKFDKPVSTAKLHRLIGESVLKKAPFPEKSFLAQSVKYGVPVFTSSPGDSSIAMNMIIPHFHDKNILLDPIMDIIEMTAIVREAEKNGVIIIGGGSPKNFYLQTQPTLWQILQDNIGGHDFFIQLTTDSPHWGGLSGATPQEAKSWGKVKGMPVNQTVVYSCASLTFPIIAKYVIESSKQRKPKRLLDELDEKAARLKERALKNPKYKKVFSNIIKSK
ncbi:MAG TPA: deoxyhypusine synthase [bacterium]|nr:deoxyhypusine synthase [bacterium]